MEQFKGIDHRRLVLLAHLRVRGSGSDGFTLYNFYPGRGARMRASSSWLLACFATAAQVFALVPGSSEYAGEIETH
jgi:hypothetical protein